MTVNFGDVTKAKNVKNDKDDEEEEALREEKRKREDDVFEKLMRKQREKMSKIDFVAKNMEVA